MICLVNQDLSKVSWQKQLPLHLALDLWLGRTCEKIPRTDASHVYTCGMMMLLAGTSHSLLLVTQPDSDFLSGSALVDLLH